LSDLDALQAFQRRVAKRPAVIEAIQAEELSA
jgi:hypothetical protein